MSSTTSYLKMNTWRMGDYIRFFNYYQELKDKKTLILDLRNNSGGEGIEVHRIASCFINKPQIINTSSYTGNNGNQLRETHVVYPNQKINLSHLKIIFLVNERTACASEEFISFMKARKKALVVGNNKTAGTYSFAYMLNFPSGLQVRLNATNKTYLADNKIIENAGIEPDVWVYIKEVNDFAPYDDKLLKVAKRLSEYH